MQRMADEEWDDREAHGIDEIIRRLPKYFTLCCMSCRNSGKSVLISQLVRELRRLKKVDLVLVMSGTAGLTSDWDFLPANTVMSFSEEMLGRIARKQDSDVEAWKHPEEGREKPKKPKHVLLVLDDCLSTPEALQSHVISSTFSLGRHRMMSCIVISQLTTKFPSPTLKQNTDMILWSRLNLRSLENLWYSTTNMSKKDFLKVSQTLGGVNFNFMLLDLYNRASRDPMDTLTVVRADPPGK